MTQEYPAAEHRLAMLQAKDARIAALEAENFRLRQPLFASPQQEPDRLDAERYRWLRDQADFLRVPEGSPQVVLTDEWGEIVSLMPSAYPRGATLDAAIDAAKEAKP